ncbi:MAG: AI-2E family transporter [Prevotellaceae bacterium]|jgi:predicted PurR-regulated permease PerM|nr:AI-2E family transporter [Prevotellaceae bacterium]
MNKSYQKLILAGGVLLVLFLAWYFSNIVVYLIISSILALVGRPVVNSVAKIRIFNKKLPRWACAATGLAAILFIFSIFLIYFIPTVAGEIESLASININEYVSTVMGHFNSVENFLKNNFPNTDFSLDKKILDKMESLFDISLKSFGSITNFVTSAAVAIFVVSFITFYFMKEESLFIDGVVILFPEKYEQGIRHAWNNSTKLLMRYFIGVFVDMLCVMTTLTIGLHFVVGLGFGTSLLLGLTAGVLNVVPYVGPLIAACISIVVALATLVINQVADPHYVSTVVKIFSVFVCMKILDDAVFQPYIFANSIKAHPLEIFLLILVAGSFAGIGGMLAAIPMYTILRVFAKEFFNKFRVVQKLTRKI